MANAPRLNAVFYATSSGNEPVREWLKGMPKQDRRAIGEDIAYVQYKWPIGKPRVDHLRGVIWEVRTSLGNRYRNVSVRCSLWTTATMLLLHGFMKKTQQAPVGEIALAEKRFKEVQHGKT